MRAFLAVGLKPCLKKGCSTGLFSSLLLRLSSSVFSPNPKERTTLRDENALFRKVTLLTPTCIGFSETFEIVLKVREQHISSYYLYSRVDVYRIVDCLQPSIIYNVSLSSALVDVVSKLEKNLLLLILPVARE